MLTVHCGYSQKNNHSNYNDLYWYLYAHVHTYVLQHNVSLCFCHWNGITMQLKYMAVFKAKVDVVSALIVMLKKTITLTIYNHFLKISQKC